MKKLTAAVLLFLCLTGLSFGAVVENPLPPIPTAVEVAVLPVPVKVIPPVIDKAGEAISVERTNALIDLSLKLDNEIKQLQLQIDYYNVILNKHFQEKVEVELMYMQERNTVILLKKHIQSKQAANAKK